MNERKTFRPMTQPQKSGLGFFFYPPDVVALEGFPCSGGLFSADDPASVPIHASDASGNSRPEAVRLDFSGNADKNNGDCGGPLVAESSSIHKMVKRGLPVKLITVKRLYRINVNDLDSWTARRRERSDRWLRVAL